MTPDQMTQGTIGQTLTWLAIIAYCASVLYAMHAGHSADHNPNHHGTRKD